MKKIYLLLTAASCILGIASSVTAQTISTFAGTATAGFSGDGGPATAAQIKDIYGVGTDNAGNVYIADRGNNRIRMVNSAGLISTVAGDGVAGSSGDGMPATAASLNAPTGAAVDNLGNLYIADNLNNRIRMVNASGMINTVAGGGSSMGDGGPAVGADIGYPIGVTVDRKGNFYIADQLNSSVRKVNASGIISTIAGIPSSPGYSGDGGAATAAQLNTPRGVAIDRIGNIYIADIGTGGIRKIDTFGIISTLAGAAYSPTGVAVDGYLNVYFSDYGTHRILKVDTFGVVSTVVGTGTAGYSGDGGPATAALINKPNNIAVDAYGRMYIADYANNCVRALDCIIAPYLTPLSGLDSVLTGSSITLTAALGGGSWTASNTHASVSASGVVTGVTPGIDTIMYTVANACGSASRSMIVKINSDASFTRELASIAEKVTISPNPATDNILVQLDKGTIKHVAITDIRGRQLLDQAADAPTLQISVSGYAPGIYFISVNGQKKISLEKH